MEKVRKLTELKKLLIKYYGERIEGASYQWLIERVLRDIFERRIPRDVYDGKFENIEEYAKDARRILTFTEDVIEDKGFITHLKTRIFCQLLEL